MKMIGNSKSNPYHQHRTIGSEIIIFYCFFLNELNGNVSMLEAVMSWLTGAISAVGERIVCGQLELTGQWGMGHWMAARVLCSLLLIASSCVGMAGCFLSRWWPAFETLQTVQDVGSEDLGDGHGAMPLTPLRPPNHRCLPISCCLTWVSLSADAGRFLLKH